MERRNRKDDIEWSELFRAGFLWLFRGIFILAALSLTLADNGWGVLCCIVLIVLSFTLTRD